MAGMVDAIATRLERRMSEVDYCGVVHVSRPGEAPFERARGPADRAHDVPHDVATRLAIASATKAFTACAVMSLVEEDRLRLATPVHDLLRHPCLEGVDRRVTVEHLLAHRSGIGDYLDESALESVEDYALSVPVHRLAAPIDYLTVLGGHSPKHAPGEGFSYCNGGYVLLARVAEIASGESYYDLLDRTVFRRAGMWQTAFLRSDDLPGSAALGYLSGRGFRTNTLHMPLRGAGDGGAYASVGDVARFWRAFAAGRIVSPATVAEMIRTRSRVLDEGMRYGLGFWLHLEREILVLRGGDPGISFSSAYDLASGALYTAISNTTTGAWRLTPVLDELLFELAAPAPGPSGAKPPHVAASAEHAPFAADTHSLDADQIAAYQSDGFVVVRGRFSGAEVREWQREAERLWADARPVGPAKVGAEKGGTLLGEPVPDRLDLVLDLSPLFWSLLADPRIADAVNGLLGPGARVCRCQLIMTPPGAQGGDLGEGYPDEGPLGVPAEDTLTVSILLDETPGLAVGDLLLSHSLAPHRRGPDHSGAPRRLLRPSFAAARHGDLYESHRRDVAARKRQAGGV